MLSLFLCHENSTILRWKIQLKRWHCTLNRRRFKTNKQWECLFVSRPFITPLNTFVLTWFPLVLSTTVSVLRHDILKSLHIWCVMRCWECLDCVNFVRSTQKKFPLRWVWSGQRTASPTTSNKWLAEVTFHQAGFPQLVVSWSERVDEGLADQSLALETTSAQLANKWKLLQWVNRGHFWGEWRAFLRRMEGFLRRIEGISEANGGLSEANGGLSEANRGLSEANGGLSEANRGLSEAGTCHISQGHRLFGKLQCELQEKLWKVKGTGGVNGRPLRVSSFCPCWGSHWPQRCHTRTMKLKFSFTHLCMSHWPQRCHTLTVKLKFSFTHLCMSHWPQRCHTLTVKLKFSFTQRCVSAAAARSKIICTEASETRAVQYRPFLLRRTDAKSCHNHRIVRSPGKHPRWYFRDECRFHAFLARHRTTEICSSGVLFSLQSYMTTLFKLKH